MKTPPFALKTPVPAFVVEFLFHEFEGQMFVLAAEKTSTPTGLGWCCLFASRADACIQLEAANLLNPEGAKRLGSDTCITNSGISFAPSAKYMSQLFYVVPITPLC